MKIEWLGHACFLITSKDGVRIITDPYATGGGLKYAPINETADVVTVSHDHGDHNNVSAVQGGPEVIKGVGTRTARGIEFTGIATHHDASQGQQRGANTVFCFAVDEMKLCHLGDLGHMLSREQVADIGAVDILLIPVGGFYTIDASVASEICGRLQPKVAIPMHFRTPRCDFPIADAEAFLGGKRNAKKMEASAVEFQPDQLPAGTQVVLLQPAL